MSKIFNEYKVGQGNVLRRVRLFVPFFIVAFIIEAMFISLMSVGWSIERYYKTSISDEYTYDYIVEGMTRDEYSLFHNKMYDLDPVEGQIASHIKHEKYYVASREYHRVYITINDKNPAAEVHFKQAVDFAKIEAENAFKCVESPILLQSSYIFNIRTVIATLWVIVFLISVFLLVSVYRVRISHYRFMYGVYMTCGADYRRLVITAISEMITVFLISLLPAFIFSIAVVGIIFNNTVMSVTFISPALPIAVISSVGVIFCAVGIPMRMVASEMPINLINKGGTAQYVISPRRSAKLFGKSFPFFYELLGVKRFAKYYAVLLTMCVVLNSLFITGIYAGKLSDDVINADAGSFSVSSEENFTDDSLRKMSKLDGVDYLSWDNSVLGMRMLSYMRVPSEKNLSEAIYTVDDIDGYDASFALNYRCFDPLLIDMLKENGLATFEGNPYASFEENGVLNVTVSRDIQNVDRFDFNIGDEFVICITDKQYEPAESGISRDARELLSVILGERASGKAKYSEYRLRITAIVDYVAPEGSIVIGVSPELFKIIGENPDRRQISVHTSDELTQDGESKLFDEISGVAGNFKGWSVERTYNALKNRLSSDTYILGVFIAVAIFVLVGVPVLWLFSQKVFYEKREEEIELLRCIGANENQLLKLYLSDGLIIAGIAFVFTMIFSALLSALLYIVATLILPFFGFRSVWKLNFELSPISLLISAGICALCGFVASFTAYLRGSRERLKAENEYQNSGKERK